MYVTTILDFYLVWGLRLRAWFLTHAAKLSLEQVALALVLALLFVAAVPGWIVYASPLVDEGHGTIGSHWKLAFLMCPLLGLVLISCRIPARRWIFLTQHGIIGMVLLTGFIWPGKVHTDMRLPAEYWLSPWLYIYTALWLPALVLGWRIVPIAPLRWQAIQEWLEGPVVAPEEIPGLRDTASKQT